MDRKRVVRLLLFPPVPFAFVFTLAAAVFLVYSMCALGTRTVAAYISYVLAFYALVLWGIRVPKAVRAIKSFNERNKYVRQWKADANLRVNVSLYGSLLWNGAYGFFQLVLGLYSHSLWYVAAATYYTALAAMRFLLVRHNRRYGPGERRAAELVRYRACGMILLAMNLALSVMVFFTVFRDRSFNHGTTVTIAMATYTFGAFAAAVRGLVKYRKYNSPVYSAAKAISLASACVSMFTLTANMLVAFDKGELSLFERRLMLGACGGAVSAFTVGMAIYMIIMGNVRLKQTPERKNGNGR